jgi:GTP pyrophosphokinase
MLDKILMDVVELSSPGRKNGSIWAPKVNGKHSKHVQHVSLKVKGELLSEGNGVAKVMQANIPMYKEVLPGLESWQASKIASWHNLEGHSIQWFSVVCIDRRGKFYSVNKSHACFSLALPEGLKH